MLVERIKAIACADGLRKYSREGRFEVESGRHDCCCRRSLYRMRVQVAY